MVGTIGESAVSWSPTVSPRKREVVPLGWNDRRFGPPATWPDVDPPRRQSRSAWLERSTNRSRALSRRRRLSSHPVRDGIEQHVWADDRCHATIENVDLQLGALRR